MTLKFIVDGRQPPWTSISQKPAATPAYALFDRADDDRPIGL
jgi:hypothetical protein